MKMKGFTSFCYTGEVVRRYITIPAQVPPKMKSKQIKEYLFSETFYEENPDNDFRRVFEIVKKHQLEDDLINEKIVVDYNREYRFQDEYRETCVDFYKIGIVEETNPEYDQYLGIIAEKNKIDELFSLLKTTDEYKSFEESRLKLLEKMEELNAKGQ